MAYTTPVTWSTAQVVTAAQLNEQVRDNMTFVHNAIYTAEQSTGAVVNATEYQNTTGKILFVGAKATASTNSIPYTFALRCGSTSPLNDAGTIAETYIPTTTSTAPSAYVNGMIPPGFYYQFYATPTTPASVTRPVKIIMH